MFYVEFHSFLTGQENDVVVEVTAAFNVDEDAAGRKVVVLEELEIAHNGIKELLKRDVDRIEKEAWKEYAWQVEDAQLTHQLTTARYN